MRHNGGAGDGERISLRHHGRAGDGERIGMRHNGRAGHSQRIGMRHNGRAGNSQWIKMGGRDLCLGRLGKAHDQRQHGKAAQQSEAQGIPSRVDGQASLSFGEIHVMSFAKVMNAHMLLTAV
jgi:hypothetical protein